MGTDSNSVTDSFLKWWKLIVAVAGGIPIVVGVIVGAVNHLVDERVNDLENEMEEHFVEVAQTVVDDDIEFQNRRLDLAEKRLERLEGMP